MTAYVAPDRDLGLQGHYAGICTRATAFLIDVIAIVLVFDIFAKAVEYLVSTLADENFRLSDLPWAAGLLLGAWALFYCTYPVTAGGRTLGMAVVGLRVIRPDGTPVGGRQAVVRALALPLSFVTLGIGFLLILVQREGRALQDLIGGTAVVYDWDARAARLRFLASRTATD